MINYNKMLFTLCDHKYLKILLNVYTFHNIDDVATLNYLSIHDHVALKSEIIL